MPPTPPTTPNRGEPLIRDRGDACPGALRLHPADDGRLARLRLPAGRLTYRQVLALADAAETLGDGHLSITSRGNAELRGLGEGCGADLAELLVEAGLLPSETHERVRNVVASPAAGLDGLGSGDVQLWARELDALLCATDWAAALSGRFLFVLDDGRGDVAGLGGDVTLIAEPADVPRGVAGAAQVTLYVGARAFRVAAADAPRAALVAAEAFLAAARAAGNGAWRVRELPAGQEPDVSAYAERAGTAAEPVPPAPLPTGAPPAPGLLGDTALSVLAPLGRLSVAQLRMLPAVDTGEVRLTPWRGAVVTGFGDRAAAGARLRELAAEGLITTPDSPWAGVGACTGRPGCAKSLSDVRADATPGLTAGLTPGPGGLPVHFSGCERRCGHPHGAWVDVVATADGQYDVNGVPTPRTSLAAAVSAARTRPRTPPGTTR